MKIDHGSSNSTIRHLSKPSTLTNFQTSLWTHQMAPLKTHQHVDGKIQAWFFLSVSLSLVYCHFVCILECIKEKYGLNFSGKIGFFWNNLGIKTKMLCFIKYNQICEEGFLLHKVWIAFAWVYPPVELDMMQSADQRVRACSRCWSVPHGGCSRRALLRGRAAAGRPPGPPCPHRARPRRWQILASSSRRPSCSAICRPCARLLDSLGVVTYGMVHPTWSAAAKNSSKKYTNQKENSYLIKSVGPLFNQSFEMLLLNIVMLKNFTWTKGATLPIFK